MSRPSPRFRVTLAPLPGGNVPAAARLRLALKILLRAFRLRAVAVEEVEETRPCPDRASTGPVQPPGIEVEEIEP